MKSQKKVYDRHDELYILDLSKLKIGDIILESGDSWYSGVIKRATNSKFSHAKFYWNFGSYIDATMQGVHSYNIQRTLYRSPQDVKVLRYKRELSQEQIENIVSEVRTKIGTPYSLLSALKTKLSFLGDEENKQFCSRLVALCYQKAGINIVENASLCTPADLENSLELIEINNCVLKAEVQQIDFCNTPTFLDQQISATNQIIQRCNELVDDDLFTLNDVSSYLFKHRELDSKFSEILNSSGYLDVLMGFELSHNKYRYDDDSFNKMVNEVKIDVQLEYKMQNDLVNRYKKEYLIHSKKLLYTKLNYVYLMQDLYQRLIDFHSKSANRFMEYARLNGIQL
ncbi:YiiX/YebB-like N1pC/P60 family cysteine hydrolase [Mannheimia indoligenes]|uniref:YiiX/YebB-like N1pC/P60 family cysteine hydrolase n=1 Tax=Mannheimia indoligenes TaxID=3103145 RepID=UPI002FE66183